MKQYFSIILLLFLLALSKDVGCQIISYADTHRVFNMQGTYYSDRFVGRKTSSGEVFVQDKFTAAHRSLKFGTLLLVTNPRNGKEVIVRVNDRCPKDKIIDMSHRAAKQIGVSSHTVEVRVLPERFRPLWEAQEKIFHLLEAGKIKKLIDDGLSPTKILSHYGNYSQDTTAARATEVELYDVELLRNSDLSAARQKVRNLPVHYQSQVVYRNAGRPGGVTVVVELSTSRKSAEAVKKEIATMFPDSRVVQAQ